MPGMKAQDGTILKFAPGTPIEMMDAMTQGYEKTGHVPQGVTTEGASNPLSALRNYLTQRAAGQIQPYQELLSQMEQRQGMPQLGGTRGVPEEQAMTAARSQIPQTPREVLLQAAGLAGGHARPAAGAVQAVKQGLGRVGLMAGAGATGAAIEGESPTGIVSGAIQGAALPATLEGAGVLPGVIQSLASRAGRYPITGPNVKLVTDAINEAAPGITFPIMRGAKKLLDEAPLAEGVKTGPDMLRWVQKEGVDRAGQLYDKVEGVVLGLVKRGQMANATSVGKQILAVGQPNLEVPTLNVLAGKNPNATRPVADLFEELKSLRSYAYGDKPLTKDMVEKGFDARAAWDKATVELHDAIGNVSPSARDLLEVAKDQYGKIRSISAALRRGAGEEALNEVFPPSRATGAMFDIGPVQRSIGTNLNPLLNRGLENFATVIARGGPIGSADVLYGLTGGRYKVPFGPSVQLPPMGLRAFAGTQNPVPATAFMQPTTGAQVETAGQLLKKLYQDYGLRE